ncbi:hypothetical protein COCCADRAFT_84086, partial [Bipolaris zeicola 26-R-13]
NWRWRNRPMLRVRSGGVAQTDGGAWTRRVSYPRQPSRGGAGGGGGCNSSCGNTDEQPRMLFWMADGAVSSCHTLMQTCYNAKTAGLIW